LQVAKSIGKDIDLTVMTNAINISFELAPYTNISLMLTGGTLRKKSYSLVGPEAESTINRYYFDKFFLGLDGLDMEFGITTPNPLEAQLNRIMVERSHGVIAVTDSSKFDKKSFSFICNLDEIDCVITDNGIFEEYIAAMENKNIKVMIV
jgi:DeoR family transcriptional regulator of aga operon